MVAAAWVWTQWSLDIGSHASYVTNATGAACTAPALPSSTNTPPSGILELKHVTCVLLLPWSFKELFAGVHCGEN